MSMVPDEERSGQAADFVTELQLTETGQQGWRFKPAPGPKVLQAQWGVPAQGVKHRVRKGFDAGRGQLEPELGRHVPGVTDEGRAIP